MGWMRLIWVTLLGGCSLIIGSEPGIVGRPCDLNSRCVDGYSCIDGTCRHADAGLSGGAAAGGAAAGGAAAGGAAAGGAAAGGTAAGGTAAACQQATERADCPVEHVCEQGACVLGCRTNSDCITSAGVNQTCCSPGTACGPSASAPLGVCFTPQWFQRQTPGAQTPSERVDGAMVFDSQRGVVVLYGGQAGTSRPNDVWEYDGGTGWANRTAPRPGTGLRYANMVFDQSRNVSILYGGADDTNGAANWLTQVHHWNGTAWSAPAAESGSIGSGPGRRIQFPMVYDSQRQRVVLLYGTGGENAGSCGPPSGNCNDLWSLTSTGWTQISVVGTTRPAETLFSNSVVYDRKRDRYLLWRPASQSAVETWLFDPGSRTWVQLSGTQVSTDRQKAVLVYDPKRERTLLIGGPTFAESPRLLDVWALPSAAADWSLENPASRGTGLDPEPTILPYAVYDSVHGRVVVFTSDSRRHTWVYGGP